jgi:hypothetical protein
MVRDDPDAFWKQTHARFADEERREGKVIAVFWSVQTDSESRDIRGKYFYRQNDVNHLIFSDIPERSGAGSRG